jgi:hypothetical protein
MFKNDHERTPKQQADRAVMRMLSRFGACGLLIYFIIKLLITAANEPPGAGPVVAGVVLIVLAVIVIAATVVEFVRSLRAGLFNASTYEELEIAEYLANRKNTESGDNGESGAEPAAQPEDTDTEDKE